MKFIDMALVQLSANASGVSAVAVYSSLPTTMKRESRAKHLYASRNLIERFFCRIKQFRRVATRYDKLSERFASFVALTAAFIWLC
ncbi:hypothetical protein CE195_03005 [Sodalis-like symbiont of Philaenus spumarius]|nr:hypothetical protein CE195_03005 [Sodalis-like symbiont of Philaenus spumarius]